MKMPISEALFSKRDEIKNFIRQHISNTRETEAVTNYILSNFCELTAPTEESNLEFFVLKSSSGIGGGRTIKPGNILLDWKKLMIDSIEGGVSIVGAITTPYLIPFAALVVCNKIYGSSKIDIDERHSILIATLWKIREEDSNIVLGENLLERLNDTFSSLGKAKLTKEEFNLLIDDLYRLKSIELNGDGSIYLVEQIKRYYS